MSQIPRAKPTDPHWIVICMSRHKEQPAEHRFRLLFMHPTEELAIAEAQRLALKHKGRRFSVYAAGYSVKVPAFEVAA